MGVRCTLGEAHTPQDMDTVPPTSVIMAVYGCPSLGSKDAHS